MEIDRVRSFTLLALLLLPPAAQAALTPAGAPLAIADEFRCGSIPEVEVIATPKGAFDVVWVDGWEEIVKGRRFDRALNPAPPVNLLPMHAGINYVEIDGTWAGRYEVAMNVLDYGTDPSDPMAAYRVSLDLDGEPLAPPVRIETRRFLEVAPASAGTSLQLSFELPLYGPPSCRGVGLLARRIDESGAPLFPENRVTRKAPSWNFYNVVTERLPNDTFVTVYSTCQGYLGLAARRLNPNGAPVGKAIKLPLPGQVGEIALAAHGGNDFAVVVQVSGSDPADTGTYTRGVVNGKVFGPTRIPTPAGLTGISRVIDLEPSPDGGYLLLFQGAAGSPLRYVLFAQELDAEGDLVGTAVQVTGNDDFAVDGAVASLPDDRWIVVTRAQHTEAEVCTERLIGTVLSSD